MTTLMTSSRGSGSKVDKRDYKPRQFTYIHKGKVQTDEVPAFGLLLQPSDATVWKEATINYLKRHLALSILDTYPAESSKLKADFRQRLDSEATPKKASNVEGGRTSVPVAEAVPLERLHRFTASDQKLVRDKTVFVTREGYLEPEEVAEIREGVSTYLRMSAQGGMFEHV